MNNTCKRFYSGSLYGLISVSLLCRVLLFLILLNIASIPLINNVAACPPDLKGDVVFDKDRPLGSEITLNSTLFNVSGNPLFYQWCGPFSTVMDPGPIVFLPEGTHAITLFAYEGIQRSGPFTLYFAVDPEYYILPIALKGKVFVGWLPVKDAQQYQLYRAIETTPSSFVKIADLPSSSITYTDPNLRDATYLYVLGALVNGKWTFSHIASAHPFTSLPKLNYPPVIYSQPVIPATVDVPYTYNVLAIDPLPDILTYSLLSSPPGMTINNLTGLIQWMPPAMGDYEVIVKVKDLKNTYMIQTFIVEADELKAPNRPPVAHAGGPYTADVGKAMVFDGSATYDPDGDTLQYAWNFGDGNNGTGVSLSHTYNTVGAHQVTLVVTDGKGGVSTDATTVTVTCQQPMVEFSADPNSLRPGDPCTLVWSSVNAQNVSIDDGIGPVNASGTMTIHPQSTTTYTIMAASPCDSATKSVTVIVNQPPVVTIDASPKSIILGHFATLTWTSANAAAITIDQGIGSVMPNGSLSVSPATATNYTITAQGPGGTATASVEVKVSPPPAPTVSLTANPTSIIQGAFSTLTWTSANADTLSISSGIGPVNPNGSTIVTPTQTTTYTITALGPGGTATSSAAVTVTPANGPPRIDSFTAACGDNPILRGSSTTLSWRCSNVDNVTTVYIEPVGSINISASPLTVSPQVTTAYNLTVSNQWGFASAQVIVKVTVPRTPLPDGSFGKQYEGFIPIDSTVQQYNTNRFSVITGIMQDNTNAPLPGVSVTILGHPEYGTAQTDSQGRFALPVEGGSLMTVVYSRNGFLIVHRNLNVPWNEIAVAETSVMIPRDTAATTITLDGNPQASFVHQSGISSDKDGTRSCTLVFKGDAIATAVDAAGNTTKTLPSTMSVRVTEFTVGPNGNPAMPAELPPQSAYTFCAEFQVDGVERVRFSKPVVAWEDNFLGLPVGTIIPVGYYDRDKGVWVPHANGVVVRLLDTNGDGIVDAIDAKGSGQPTDLNGNGDFSDEVAGLQQNTSRFQVGKTYWRVEMSHFSTMDFNLAYLVPNDTQEPNPKYDPLLQGGEYNKENVHQCYQVPNAACSVEDRSQSVHEDIPVPGTDISLHYASSRAQGNRYTITVPASGDTVSSSLSYISVQMSIAGKVYSNTLTAGPNRVATFVWDGLDAWGNQACGRILADIKIGFAYPAHYASIAEAVNNPSLMVFGRNGGGSTWTLGSATRLETIVWKQFRIVIQKESLDNSIAHGWSANINHHVTPYDPNIIYKGDGSIVDNESVRMISTFANFSSSPGSIRDVACDSQGNVYVALLSGSWGLYKFDKNGVRTTLDTRPIAAVTVDSHDNIYYSVHPGHCVGNISTDCGDMIYKIGSDGIPAYVAGTQYGNGSESDNIPATQAYLPITSLAVDKDQNIYFGAAFYNYSGEAGPRVRKIDTNGIVSTVAGSGWTWMHGGNYNYPGPARGIDLEGAYAVTLDAHGNIYFSGGSAIFKVDTSGWLTCIAGGRYASSFNDGIPATSAIVGAAGLKIDGSGNIFFSETSSYKTGIMKIDSRGIISTIAGGVTPGFYRRRWSCN